MIGIGKQENGRRQGLFDMIAADSSHWSGGKETFFQCPLSPLFNRSSQENSKLRFCLFVHPADRSATADTDRSTQRGEKERERERGSLVGPWWVCAYFC